MSETPVELWFDFASPYSYLTVMRIERAAAPRALRWMPFLLGPIFQAQGWSNSPFVLQPVKGRHMWVDMERQCRKYALPWRKPSEFPRRSVLAARVGVLGEGAPWLGEFCRRMMEVNFVEDRDIDAPDIVAAVLASLGLPADDILSQANSEGNRARLRARTQTAMDRGVFGAPTFFVDGEMYWGNDRIEDALDEHRYGQVL